MPPEAASSLSPRGSPSYDEAKLKRTDALKNSGAFESEGREGRQGENIIYNGVYRVGLDGWIDVVCRGRGKGMDLRENKKKKKNDVIWEDS